MLVAQDRKLLFTLTSYVLVLAVYVNLTAFQTPILGIAASTLYFIINGIFLGHAFFEKEDPFLRVMLGILLLVMLLGFAGWLELIIYNLDVLRFTFALATVATVSSILHRRLKPKNAI
jgi:hypothetical protein